MNRPPAFQFYVKDHLTSKKRAAMGLDQQAACMNLLCHMWDTDDCSLPNDPIILAALSELRDQWNTRSTLVQQAFVEHPKKPGYLTNLRLYFEHQKYLKIQKERRRAGRESGLSRRKYKQNNSEHMFNKRSPNDEQMANSSSSSSNSNKKKKETDNSPTSLSPEEIQNRWNAIPGVKDCKDLGLAIRNRVRTRITEHPDLSWWDELFKIVQASDFLCGRTNGRNGPFYATLDWLLSPRNLEKALAGNYDSIASTGHGVGIDEKNYHEGAF